MDYPNLVLYLEKIKFESDYELLNLQDYINHWLQSDETKVFSDKIAEQTELLQTIVELIIKFITYSTQRLIVYKMHLLKQLVHEFEDLQKDYHQKAQGIDKQDVP